MGSETDNTRSSRRQFSRRQYLQTAIASGAGIGLAGCAGGGGGGDSGSESSGGSTSGSTSESETTIQFASDDTFKGQQSRINELLHENGVSDNVTVEILGGSFVSSGRKNKYGNILSASQQQPTMFMMDNGWTIPFIARGQIANLSNELDDSLVSTIRETYIDTMVATATQNGDLYGVPLFADFPVIQYRKDKVLEAGYSESELETWSTESMSWQKFSNVVADTMESNPEMRGYNFQGAAYIGLSCCNFVEIMSAWGGSYFGDFENLFGPIGDRPVTVNEEPVVQAINMIRHFIHDENPNGQWDDFAGGISPEAVVQYKEESSRKPFTNGEVLFHRNWPYAININADSEDGLGQEKLGTMPIPYGVTPEESKYGPEIGGIPAALGGWHVTLNPNAPDEKKAAAKEVMEALTKKPVQIGLADAGGWLPPVADTLRSDELKENTSTVSPHLDSLAVAAENAVPRPVTVVWPQQAQQVNSEVNAAFKQEKSAREAMDSLHNSLTTLEEQNAQ